MFNLLLKHKQIFKYLIAGSIGTFVNLALLYFFTDILLIWYLLSAVLAFILSFFVSFFLQKFWTFSDRDKDKMYRQMAGFLLVALANLVLNTLLMYLLVDGLEIWYMLAQFIISAFIAVESYLIYKFLIFNRNGQAENGKIKILIASGIYPPDFRGPATMLKALPGTLEKNDFLVKIITYSDIKATVEEKGKVFRILRRGPAWLRHAKYFFTIFKLAGRSDVIYATDIYSVGYFAYLLKKILGKKYIIRFAGDSAWETAVRLGLTNDYIVDFQKKTYNQLIEKLKSRRRKIMIKADKVIVVSRFLAGIAAAVGVKKDQIKLIYNSVDFIEDNSTSAKIAKVRSSYGEPVKIIVSAGELNPWKGFDGIIKSLLEIKKNLKNKVYLLILGDGQEKENLKKLAEELGVSRQVIFLGKIGHSEIINYFKAADVFILNSNYEGLSHTLLEVMKAGRPIICSNIEANREVIEDNKSGLIVNYNDAGEISRAVIRILTDPALSENLVREAKEKLKLFSWDETVRLTAEVIREVIL